MVKDPEKFGVLTNNFTGITLRISIKDQIEKLKTIMPDIKTIGAIYDPQKTGYFLDKSYFELSELGINLVMKKVKTVRSVPDILRRMSQDIDVFWLISDSSIINNETYKYFLLFTLENGIPILSYSEAFAVSGSLIASKVSFVEIGRQCGELANKVSRKSDTFPLIISPKNTKFILSIRTAEKLGFQVPVDDKDIILRR